ncbi:MAG: hypothetical protein LBL21_02380 [Rickettsiales bacterium]|nr:hypothetical protein [Rickettsiales bacterium]
MKKIFIAIMVAVGAMPAAHAAKVCVQVSSYCAASHNSRAGSGTACWCSVGGVWSWSGAYGTINGESCSTWCPGTCGAI